VRTSDDLPPPLAGPPPRGRGSGCAPGCGLTVLGIIVLLTSLVASLIAGATAWEAYQEAGLPSEVDMRPEKELTFPGATETSQRYTGEHWGRTIDGRLLGQWTNLRRAFRAAAPFPEVVEWYRDELGARGWTVVEADERWAAFSFRTEVHEHKIRVTRIGDSSQGLYDVVYEVVAHAEPG